MKDYVASQFPAALSNVLNRGSAPLAFLVEMIVWARSAPNEIFAPNKNVDIYSKVKPELGPFGPYPSLIEAIAHRKAVMLEVMRVLAGFESSWDWKEGVDTSRLGSDTAANSEAGAWQLSYDFRLLSSELKDFVRITSGVTDGIQFQRKTKFDHVFAMECVSRLLRVNTKHNGPLYKGNERFAIRSSLRGAEHSIYPWLKREAVEEFQRALA